MLRGRSRGGESLHPAPSVSPSFNHRLLLVASSTLAEVPLTGLSFGVSEHVVRTVSENSRTLKFTSHGFEKE